MLLRKHKLHLMLLLRKLLLMLLMRKLLHKKLHVWLPRMLQIKPLLLLPKL